MKNMQITESGNNEWYTPKKYIESAKSVMGCIDIDPASNEYSQKYIQANKYYSKKDDGLLHKWEGNIWLNPPVFKKTHG